MDNDSLVFRQIQGLCTGVPAQYQAPQKNYLEIPRQQPKIYSPSSQSLRQNDIRYSTALHHRLESNINRQMALACQLDRFDKIKFFEYTSQVQKTIIETHLKKNSERINRLNHKDLSNEKNNILIWLENFRCQKNQILSACPQLSILYIQDPQTFQSALQELEQSLSPQELQAFYQQALKLKTLETDAQIYQLALNQCNDRISKFEIPIAQNVNQRIASASTPEFVRNEMVNLTQEIKQLEIAIAQGQKEAQALHTKIFEIAGKRSIAENKWANWTEINALKTQYTHLEKSLVATRQTVSQYCERLEAAKVELAIFQQQLHQALQQQSLELKQVQTFYKSLNEFSSSDQNLLNAVEASIKDVATFTAYNSLTAPAKELLSKCGISSEKFESITHANALQKHLFEQVGQVVNETALLSATYANDAQIAQYFQATLEGCSVAVDMITSGTPQQAVASTKLSSALYESTQIAIAVAKGVGHGMIISAQEAVEQGLLPKPVKLAKDLGQMLHFAYQIACIENKKEVFMQALDQFKQTPMEQKAEHITALLSTFLIPTPNKLHAGIQNTNKLLERITKIAKTEYAGLKALHKVEASTINAAHQVKGKNLYSFAESFDRACLDLMSITSKGQKEVHAVEQCAAAASSSSAASSVAANVAHATQETEALSVVLENSANITAQEMHDLEAACHSLGECSKRISVNVAAPELQAQVSEALKHHCDTLAKRFCTEHKLVLLGKNKENQYHLMIPEELKAVILNEKDWEKLVKVFDGVLVIPNTSGKSAWYDYQHLMGPVVNVGCQSDKIFLQGFHHDYLGKVRQSGLIEYTNIVQRPHGFYEANWAYGNVKKSAPSTFFPDHWTPNQVMSKIEEAMKNNPKVKFKDGQCTMTGITIAEGIKIKVVFETKNGQSTGKIITAYPMFRE